METKDTGAVVRFLIEGDNEMVRSVRSKSMLATFLLLAIVMGTFGSFSVDAQRRYSGRNRRPHHSRAKGALIGGGIGLLGGALIGGRKGALIGAGAGAGTGYLVQRHRNHRRHRRHFRRY